MQAWGLKLYQKRDSGTGVFLWILWNFLEHLFTEHLWTTASIHWNKYLSNLGKKLSRSIGLLSKIRHYVPEHLLRKCLLISLFLILIWYMPVKSGVRNKIAHIFKNFWSFKKSLFLETKIVKIADFIKCRYTLFVRSSLRKEGVSLFNDMFTTTNHNYNHITRCSVNHLLSIPQGKTTHFDDYFTACKVWNNLYRCLNCNLLTCKNTEFKNSIQRTFLDKYSNDN